MVCWLHSKLWTGRTNGVIHSMWKKTSYHLFNATKPRYSRFLDKRYSTYANAIQYQMENVTMMKKLLSIASVEKGKFLYFEDKWINPIPQAKAIRAQQAHMANTRVVAIKGISPDIMRTFESYLETAEPRIQHVLCTSRSNDGGRYSLVTSRKHMRPVAKDLHSKLSDLYRYFFKTTSPTAPKGA